ncbi:MAG: hypothetical protein V1867_00460 [Candidatus Falkowbacteria bacterium]
MSERSFENLIAEKADNESPKMYNLDNLEKAKKNLKEWQDAFADDSSNNPDKYLSQIRSARRQVRAVVKDLKERGILEMTTEEKISAELDKLYPKAKSKTVVEYNENKYRLHFFPLEHSRSRKTVTEWGHQWVMIDADTKVSNFVPKEKLTGDIPFEKDGTVDIAQNPMTPKAYNWLKEKGILMKDYPELKSWAVTRSQIVARQLTRPDLEYNWDEISAIISREYEQGEMAAELPMGWTKEKIVDINIWFEAGYGNQPTNLKIIGITESGYRVTIKAINTDKGSVEILDKIKMTEMFTAKYIGGELEFNKMIKTTFAGEKRPYCRANPKNLPGDISKLSFVKIKNWYNKIIEK